MITMITTEEYKELILAQQSGADCEDALLLTVKELREVEDNLKELILLITQGETKAKWGDGKFEGFDLAPQKNIADYINKNYVKDGKVTFKKVEETDNE